MVQMACLFGAEVAGLELTEEKFPAIEQVGGKPVLSRSFADLNLAALWAGQKPTVVIDLVGRVESLTWGMATLATSGRMVVLTTFREITFPADPRELVFREINLVGSRYASKVELLEAAELVASGRIKPVVTNMVSPEQVSQVHQALQASSLVGRGTLLWPH
jgi:propanol-preferring alcohol dehydrogenase